MTAALVRWLLTAALVVALWLGVLVLAVVDGLRDLLAPRRRGGGT